MNNVILLGRLTKDPELSRTASGFAIVNISIAVDDIVSKDSEKTTSFFTCKAFGNLADTIVKYFRKGHRILLNGALKQENWTNKEGNKVNTVVINVQKINFIENHKNSDNDNSLNNIDNRQEQKQVEKYDYNDSNDLPF